MIDARRNRRRLAVAVLAVFAIVVVFSIRLIDIQVVRADDLKSVAGTNYRTDTLWGTRGSIVDENGTVLATSVDRFNITAAPINVDLEGFERRVTGEGKRTVHVSVMEALQEIADITGADVQQMYTTLTADPDAQWAMLVKGIKLDLAEYRRPDPRLSTRSAASRQPRRRPLSPAAVRSFRSWPAQRAVSQTRAWSARCGSRTCRRAAECTRPMYRRTISPRCTPSKTRCACSR